LLDICKKSLEKDFLYRSRVSRNDTLSKKWLIKRCVRVAIKEILPDFASKFISRSIRILYYKYHYFRPTHLMELKKNRDACLMYVSVIGGFGDMLMLYPYIKKIKKKHNKTLVIVLNNKHLNKYSNLSYSPSRIFKIDGVKVDFVREFLERNPGIDFINYGDGWGNGYEYAYIPFLREEYGEQFTKSSFKDDLENLFIHKDFFSVKEFSYRKKIQDNEKYITFYFKTSEKVLSEVFLKYISINKNKKIIILGSPSKKVLDIIKFNKKRYIDLTNSYSSGLDTMALLLFVKKYSEIFIGGRGGFEAFFLLVGTPSVNVFDIQGKQEWNDGLWSAELWRDNFIKEPYWCIDSEVKEDLVDRILESIVQTVGKK
jgi:hypothetical protein